MDAELLAEYQAQFTCGFEKAKEVFPACLAEAHDTLSPEWVVAYLDGANFLCKIGMGVEPVLVYLEVMPEIASHIGKGTMKMVADFSYKLARSPNKKALIPFLASLGSVCRRIDTIEDLQHYFEIIESYVDQTQTVIHGHHSIHESPGMIVFMENVPQLISKLTLAGIRNFVDYGARNYKDSPDQQIEYFSLSSHDAKSIIQREREGTVFKDVERHLGMLKDCMWDCDLPFSVFSTAFDQLRKPVPYLDEGLIAVPDVYDTENTVPGIDRYRAMLAHMMAHRKWSTKLMADNFAPHMQLFISVFEDSRVEYLAMQKYPGLKKLFLALHPYPEKGACDDQKQSCLRYRAARLSRALLDETFDSQNPLIEDFRQQFHAILQEKGEKSTTQDMAKLGTGFYVKSRKQSSDSLPDIFFDDTEISYRDDNRYIWFHHEENDEAEDFHNNEYESDEKVVDTADSLPPRHYDEWDYLSESYRPDWATVYERLHPSGDVGKIDRLMEKHDGLAKRLKQMIEMLKPQNKKRIRFQEEGEELDLDVALRSIIDFKSGQAPDPRINYSHTTDSRNIAVMLLVDTSQSLNERNQQTGQTLLELSEEALAITAWTVEQLGDKFAIAGFCSDTRHEVRYQHIKGYSEHYGDEVKARIAAMEASYSTRMGAAMRHAAHYLEAQKAEKKLMLVLTDGEPADIDTKDPQMLIQDTHKAVEELQGKGIYSYCITLDPKADEYVADIFGNQYTVIDHVDKLPEQLPQVFMKLTH
ncbi:MAG: VWA domain-containing protein [Thiomicrorhabdus chilensis]|uniref:nitric oxide reductase activation protein NorD n=1 Tax=Thiomicrorhabdus chilensis TaxID=63656 RepID=UPI00299F152B|nr:VWA domain-containing protein [Thiomicrorhabdus chilensis]MDX1346811.1 VWA domain-containing protein [Thiomicrorhabdus chilensis]